MQVGERLRKVFEVGGTLALFPVLKDWPTEELRALLKDVEEYMDVACSGIDRAVVATKQHIGPEAALAHAPLLDSLRDDKKMEVTMMASEICSVALFYLHERGVEVEIPE